VKQEKPQGRVLRPDESLARAGKYAPANWEERMKKVPVTTSVTLDQHWNRAPWSSAWRLIMPRELIHSMLAEAEPIVDEIDGVPIVIVRATIRNRCALLKVRSTDASSNSTETKCQPTTSGRCGNGERLGFFRHGGERTLDRQAA
jgi:hypothetical protein